MKKVCTKQVAHRSITGKAMLIRVLSEPSARRDIPARKGPSRQGLNLLFPSAPWAHIISTNDPTTTDQQAENPDEHGTPILKLWVSQQLFPEEKNRNCLGIERLS
jgi:hypothetical protein